MAETFLFPIATQILGKLSNIAIHKIGVLWGMEKELNRLKSTLSAIKAVLLDADEQQGKSEHVKDWLQKLQDVLYDADDVLDDFTTESLRQEMIIQESKRKRVGKFFSSSNSLIFHATMSSKIKQIRERMDDIATDRKNFKFTERLVDGQVPNRSREQTHSFVRYSDVVGRERDKEHIVAQLIASFSHMNISVLPIVGLGGLGKTTLAQMVYNDSRINQSFEKRIWVCVSEDFDLKMLTQRILSAATGVNNSNMVMDELQTSLRSELISKRFLLVLDDVWNEDPKRWIDLRDLLSSGAEGSKIIVTTRSQTVASIMGTSQPYNLKGLSTDECFSLFLKCAFRDGKGKENPNLLEIGKAIVRKCGGIPLAVRTLGSLLYTKTEERDWLYINDNDIWKISQRENDILPILKLSYDQMPTTLKQCFAYCTIFPKDYQIPREELINLWIAQGFVQSLDGSRHVEDIGNEYFNELLSRSFFQDVEETFDCEVLSCKMHDLLHDLARSVAGEQFSNVNFDAKTISERVRHLLLCEENLWGKEFPGLLLKLKKVRSFSFAFKVGPIRQTFLEKLIDSFQCLRVLDLSESNFKVFPASVGTLAHLRYLALCDNHSITTLPDSICNLVNLQTLYLLGCEKLQHLPRDFGNLCSLRHLYLTSTMKCLPEDSLKGLRSLQSLSISRCYNLESLSQGMKYLTALRALYVIRCPSLISLPESMMYLTSLEKLWILDCDKIRRLDMYGLRRIQSLVIWGLLELQYISELQHGDATLKYLCIQNCPYLTTSMFQLGNFKSLLKLEVVDCSSLVSLSLDQLTALQVLCIKRCPRLEIAQYMSRIRHIPDTHISQGSHTKDRSTDARFASWGPWYT